MAVPFMDLKRGTEAHDRAVREAVLRVLDHKNYILGREVEEFEKAVAARLDGAFVVGVSSGTDALLAGLMALDIGAGDEVVTSPFSFFATAGTIVRRGARPVLVDIDPVHFELDPRGLTPALQKRAKAIIPVHLFGHTMNLDPVLAWAAGRVTVFEDAAQAIGGSDERGRAAGTIGRMGAFSFFPTKNLGAMGDAGMIVTRDAELAARLRRLRTHGQSAAYVHAEVGGNFRLDAIQAAALGAGLGFLDGVTEERRKNARGYLGRIREAGLDGGQLVPPRIDARHTVHQFVIRIPGGRRDAVLAGLKERQIGAAVYYPVPFHLQPCFAVLGHEKGAFPQAESAASEVLALPIFPGLTEVEQDEVVGALANLL